MQNKKILKEELEKMKALSFNKRANDRGKTLLGKWNPQNLNNPNLTRNKTSHKKNYLFD